MVEETHEEPSNGCRVGGRELNIGGGKVKVKVMERSMGISSEEAGWGEWGEGRKSGCWPGGHTGQTRRREESTAGGQRE